MWCISNYTPKFSVVYVVYVVYINTAPFGPETQGNAFLRYVVYMPQFPAQLLKYDRTSSNGGI